MSQNRASERPRHCSFCSMPKTRYFQINQMLRKILSERFEVHEVQDGALLCSACLIFLVNVADFKKKALVSVASIRQKQHRSEEKQCSLCLAVVGTIFPMNSVSRLILLQKFDVQVDDDDWICTRCLSFLSKVSKFKERLMGRPQRVWVKRERSISIEADSDTDSVASDELAREISEETKMRAKFPSKKVPKSDPYCIMCLSVFENIKKLKIHYSTAHKDLNMTEINCLSSKCSICQKQFSTRPSVMIHLKQFHFNKTNCDPQFDTQGWHCCKIIFKTFQTLKIHIESFHPSATVKINRSSCWICRVKFLKQTKFNAHFKEIHKKECQFCSLPLNTGMAWNVHLESCHSEECNPVVTVTNERVAPKKVNRLVCCRRVFKNKTNLKNHKETLLHMNNTGTKKKKKDAFFCIFCYVKCGSKLTLKSHYETEHVGLARDTMKDLLRKCPLCDVCRQKLATVGIAKRHREKMHPQTMSLESNEFICGD